MSVETDTDVRDITIIGAGPVGLCAAFWAGMREASARIVDSLPEIGGQLTTLYPEKWIFDVPGHPKVLARDLVAQLREQIEPFDVPIHLETTAASISYEGEGDDRVVVLHTDRRPGAAVAHGRRLRRPRRVRAQEAAGLRRRHGAVGGQGRPLPRGREARVRSASGS